MLDGGGHVMVSGNVGVDMHYGCGFTMLGLALVRVLIHGPLLKGNSMPCVPVDTQLQQCPFLGEGLGGPVDSSLLFFGSLLGFIPSAFFGFLGSSRLACSRISGFMPCALSTFRRTYYQLCWGIV